MKTKSLNNPYTTFVFSKHKVYGRKIFKNFNIEKTSHANLNSYNKSNKLYN